MSVADQVRGVLLAAPVGFSFSELLTLVNGNKFTVRSALNQGIKRGELEKKPDGKFFATQNARNPRKPGRPPGVDVPTNGDR